MTGIYPAPILDKAGETQVNNISIVIHRDSGSALLDWLLEHVPQSMYLEVTVESVVILPITVFS